MENKRAEINHPGPHNPRTRDSLTGEELALMLEEGLRQAEAGKGMELEEAFKRIEEGI